MRYMRSRARWSPRDIIYRSLSSPPASCNSPFDACPSDNGEAGLLCLETIRPSHARWPEADVGTRHGTRDEGSWLTGATRAPVLSSGGIEPWDETQTWRTDCSETPASRLSMSRSTRNFHNPHGPTTAPFPRLTSTSTDVLANHPTASASEDAYIIRGREKAESGRVMQRLRT
ncbi:hypothetical protein CSOJ01_06590 [Colletotrichum sojae]|uniref:Uncharacterized protein n=1 Tax=Colletotrichum sojae TaxID=2175907 RepID=A0A8H6JBC3_9PEZI|nr:hypothetical protein CSOJ01_06590 [Colletotrichum sojae]